MRTLLLPLFLAFAGIALAVSEPVLTPDGRYVCSQGGLSSGGTYHWGWFDVAGDTYQPYTGDGGAIVREGDDLLSFAGGLFEYYDWVGVLRTRDDGVTEVALLERADLDAFLAGASEGGGSGYIVYCGWDGTR